MVTTEFPDCGTEWSDGRVYCDHDHCDRAHAVRLVHRKLQDAADIQAIKQEHRYMIGMVLRGDKEIDPNQITTLIRHGYAKAFGRKVLIEPAIEAAYRTHYDLRAPRVIVHRIV